MFLSLPLWSQETASTNTPPAAASSTPASNAAPVAPTLSKADAEADTYVKFGIAKGQAGDMAAAMAAFDQAIKINPQYAPAYHNRGYANSLQHKFDLAIVDYDKAIEIDPKDQDAYYNRGVAKAQKGDFDEAILDFNATIKINPKHAQAYYNRGHAKYFLGDLNGTMDDANQAITLDPANPYSYFIRGLVRHALLDREGATADFQKTALSGYPYGVFWLWIVQMEAGQRGIARANLSDLASKTNIFKDKPWAAEIASFLLEKTTQDQLIAKANQEMKGHLCEAWFYAGMAKRFSGDNKGAIECFQKAVDTKVSASEEYIEAQREVTKLQSQ